MSLSKFFIPHPLSKPSPTAACRLGFLSFPPCNRLRLLEVPDWGLCSLLTLCWSRWVPQVGEVGGMLRFWYNPAALRGLCVTPPPEGGLLPFLEKSQWIFSDK